MSSNLDTTILTGFQQGDERAFQLLMNHYYPALYNFIKKIINDPEEAKDIILHAFRKLFERYNQFEAEPPIKKFLYVTARNKSIDFLQAQKRLQESQKEMIRDLSNDVLLQYEYDIMDELVDRLNAAIENLSEEKRKIFKLLYYENMTPSEIAAQLRISVQTVYTQKNRAISALRLLILGKSLFIIWEMMSNYLHER